MKFKILILCLIAGISAAAQTASPVFTAPVSYFTVTPTGTPSAKGSRFAIDNSTNRIYQWQPVTLNWNILPYGIDEISGCSAPAFTPGVFDSPFAVNKCDTAQLYYYHTGAWHIVGDGRGGGSGGGSSTNLTFTGASSPFTLNSSTGTDVTFAQGTGVTLSRSANELTVTNTGDLSNTNELQTLYTDDQSSTDWTIGITPGGNTLVLEDFTSTLAGLTPGSGGGTTNFLRADGTWAAPPGGGGSLPSAEIGYGNGSTIVSDTGFVRSANKVGINTGTPTRNLDAIRGTIRGNIQDRGGATFNVAAYNIYPDGTDQTVKIQKLLDTVYALGGGHITFNPGTYRINGRLRPKDNYNGSNIPQTPDMWISGSAGNQSGNAQKPTGGTIFDCRYQGDTIGCFQFRGTGQVKITDISFIKGTTGLTNTFIHSTLTTLKISDCAFWGYDVSNRCRAIVLGGNTAFPTAPDSTAEMGFQGYGTTIEKNYFNFITAGVMFQTYANAVVVRDNNFWNGCGGFAAIWLAAKNDTNTGNVVQNNLIEMNNYTYGIYLGALSVSNSIYANNFYDGPVGSKNIGSAATSANTIIEGFNGAGKPFTGNVDVDTRISMQGGDTSYFASNILYRTGNFVGHKGGVGERIFSTATPSEFFQTSFGDISGVKNAIWRWNNGVVSNEVIQIQDFNPLMRFILRADATDEFAELTSSGNLRIYPKTNGELYIGSGGNLNHLFLSGIQYGGLTSTTTVFKTGQGDRIYWGDTSSPFSGESAGLTSSAAAIMRTIDGSNSDARHQALEFYATGTGANTLPGGTDGQRPTLSGSQYGMRYNTTGSVWEGWNGSAWVAAASGDITNGGNTTGAAITIGTNDNNALNFETNNVTRVSIASGASTGGATTHDVITANTSTVQDAITVRTNSTGTAAAGFGARLLMQLESSTTDNQDAGAVSSIWTTATHASRTSALQFSGVNNAGSLGEFARFEGATAPVLKIASAVGTAGTTTYGNSGIVPGVAYSIISNNDVTIGSTSFTGRTTITSGNGSVPALSVNGPTGQTTTILSVGNGNGSNATSGTRSVISANLNFLPSSGTTIHNDLLLRSTINQTGGANGVTRGVSFEPTLTSIADYRAADFGSTYTASSGTGATTGFNYIPTFNLTGTASGLQRAVNINPTLTSLVSAGQFRAVDIGVNNANAYGIYQTGALTTNKLVGKTGFGSTSAPTALVTLAAGTATASTAPLKFTSGTNLTSVENGAVEYDGTDYFVSSGGTRFLLTRTLRGSATLDFPSTAAGTVSDLTITVTGAADGDVVSFSVPNASQTADGRYSAWVSATDTVTIRFSPISTADPASGTFKATIQK